jgi:RNA polymerase sigma-70 factor, ECF subfamily
MSGSDRIEGRAMSDQDVEFAWLFKTEYEAVVRTVYLILHDRERARDITQDAFMELLTRWNRISRYERPDAWVRRVAIRMAIRFLNRERRRPWLERELDPGTLPQPVDVDLLQAIRQLPAAQRAAVVLFYFEDRPLVEVADILDVSAGTARVTLHRARRHLAELLGEDEPAEEVADVP